jgi:hypothetical protein
LGTFRSTGAKIIPLDFKITTAVLPEKTTEYRSCLDGQLARSLSRLFTEYEYLGGDIRHKQFSRRALKNLRLQEHREA